MNYLQKLDDQTRDKGKDKAKKNYLHMHILSHCLLYIQADSNVNGVRKVIHHEL